MSLIDAFLLEPYRIHIWISFRTDGIKGSGTQNDPYDGSTAARFDELMNSPGAHTTVRFRLTDSSLGRLITFLRRLSGLWPERLAR